MELALRLILPVVAYTQLRRASHLQVANINMKCPVYSYFQKSGDDLSLIKPINF